MSKSEVVLHASVDRLLRIEEAMLVVGMGETAWKEMVAAGTAPAPVRLSAKIVRWRLSELQQWIAALPKTA